MITQIAEKCNNRYTTHMCTNCSYTDNCPHNCEKCLEYIHFPQRAPAPRKYDCKRMADYYFCKYSHKYSSELIYAFSSLEGLAQKTYLSVLSIGCGPCTDLLALEHLYNTGVYSFFNLDYIGIELVPDVWSNIYNDIYNNMPPFWTKRIVAANICDYLNVMQHDKWRPDLISLQYVFSDMQKHEERSRIESMICDLASYFDSCENGTYLVCNDINLSTFYGGGREYFDDLLSHVNSNQQYYKKHFCNSNKNNHFDYGVEWEDNKLIVNPPETLSQYSPFMSCASAQMIIKKV